MHGAVLDGTILHIEVTLAMVTDAVTRRVPDGEMTCRQTALDLAVFDSSRVGESARTESIDAQATVSP